MNLEKIIKTFTVLEFISSNPNCRAPEIRDFIGIINHPTPNKEEKEFYSILNSLSKDGYIVKLPIKKLGSGGAHFALSITGKGTELMTSFVKFSSRELKNKGRYSEDRTKQIMVESMIRLFSSESFDVIFELIQELMGIKFDNATVQKQEAIIYKVNDSVLKISNKASEIAKSFF